MKIYRRNVKVVALLAGLFLLCAGSLCEPPYRYLLTDADGQPIDIAQVQEITTDSELSDDEKREALQELGIEDELLIELLIRDFSGT